MKKVIIFDLDGTLLDTLEDLQKAVNFALSHFDYPLRTLEQVRKDIGNGLQNEVDDLGWGERKKEAEELFEKNFRNNK